jgi:hypothetical protein
MMWHPPAQELLVDDHGSLWAHNPTCSVLKREPKAAVKSSRA